nr:hypothetical protein [Tanacetum cinerariifolium]
MLHLLHIDLCSPLRIASINGKRKLGAKGDIGFFIGYSADSCAFKVYNQRTKKIMETMNVSFDELLAMAFEQHSSKPRLQSMTSGQISLGLDLTYALSTKTTLQPTEGELDLLFEAMYDDYIGGQPSTASRTVLAAQAHQALYGLKQAPRAWYNELSMFLLQNHFFKGTTDPTLFIRRFVDDILVPLRNVDDGGNDVFPWVTSNQSPCGIFINQSNYVLEILKKYGIESCDPVGTLMEFNDKLDPDQNRNLVDATKYRSMIGALMYLTSSRSDIVHATCLCARYQAKPTEKHLKEVKRIFRYLRGTVNTGLWYTKDSGSELTGFSDADYARCKHIFKSTSGRAQFLVLWMRTPLTDYGFHFNKIPIYCDSKSAIAISCNPVQHSRIKHIVVRYHFIKEHVEKGTIELYFVKTDYQLAELFTKALPADRFNYLVRHLGMRSLSPQELDCLAKS